MCSQVRFGNKEERGKLWMFYSAQSINLLFKKLEKTGDRYCISPKSELGRFWQGFSAQVWDYRHI